MNDTLPVVLIAFVSGFIGALCWDLVSVFTESRLPNKPAPRARVPRPTHSPKAKSEEEEMEIEARRFAESKSTA